MKSTTRLTISSLASSAKLQRDRSTPMVAGNSQAMALISAFNRGGKDPGPARSGAVVQAVQPLFDETLAPAVNYLRAGIAAGRDLHIRRPPVRPIARSWPAAPRRSEPCNNVPDARLSALLNVKAISNGLKLPRATASLLLDERNATHGPSPQHQSNHINVVPGGPLSRGTSAAPTP
jgi:hypothetical protein